jgi:hypothetical protein
MTLLWLVVGSPTDGVVRHGVAICRQLGDARLCHVANAADAVALSRSAFERKLVNVSYVDRSFPSDARALRELLLGLRGTTGRLSVTFHDVPQAEEGDERVRRRCDTYRLVASLCDVAIVSSEHEAHTMDHVLARRYEIAWPHVERLPLPRSTRAIGPPTLATLGFVHPGKRIDALLDVAHTLGGGIAVHCLGAVAPGHDEHARTLRRHARRVGVPFTITGWLDDTTLGLGVTTATVPVVIHRHFSASASIGSWVGAGRRPLAPRHPYTEEFVRRHPGTVELFVPTGEALVDAVARRLADPEFGRHHADLEDSSLAAAASRFAHIFEQSVVG